jgi:hypothetical protein
MHEQYGKPNMSQEQYRDFLETLHDTCPPDGSAQDSLPNAATSEPDTSGAMQPVRREGTMSRLLKCIDTEKNKPDWLQPGL